MHLLLLAATAAHAAPSSAACKAWANKLKGAAADTMAGLASLNDPRMRDLGGTIAPGVVMATVKSGVCRIQTVATVDLRATLTLPAMGGRMELTCPVQVDRAVVPLQLVVGGSDAAPRVQSSVLPVEALGPFMRTCVQAPWVQDGVVAIASGWVQDQKPVWHAQIDRWLVL